MRFFHNLAFNGDAAMSTITVLTRPTGWLLHILTKVLDPMAPQVVSVAGIVLPRLLLISKSNSPPAIVTIWQDLRDDGYQEIIFIILCALSPRHDGTACTNKQRPGNHQMKGRGAGSRKCTLSRGRGAHFGGEGG
jgi:hypothetical protein